MCVTIATAGLERVAVRSSGLNKPSEPDESERIERFLWAVSAGWPQVMDFLESCDLACEAQRILHRLRQSD